MNNQVSSNRRTRQAVIGSKDLDIKNCIIVLGILYWKLVLSRFLKPFLNYGI